MKRRVGKAGKKKTSLLEKPIGQRKGETVRREKGEGTRKTFKRVFMMKRTEVTPLPHKKKKSTEPFRGGRPGKGKVRIGLRFLRKGHREGGT